ncbi:von Willebrand factor A domain-containing protein 1 [Prinia subflava]|uniref:von Willebrand factor A domain-containing protein 1 n=1 Tax=Prinia subflava TaxID=208062 RepID=UPI002FE41289
MSPKALLALGLWLRFAAGRGAPEPGPQPPTSNAEGDLLFLLDSSASVSPYEFSKVKEFMWDLLQPFSFGPRDVQASLIHISTAPTTEFPFNQHWSGAALRGAIGATRQLMGDTNTGRALAYAKEQLFGGHAGARPGVPKVLVWVTDGFSTDDISQPMRLLKDMGVTVFIVSTGRRNFLQLSAAASQPADRHLHFVDVDDLHIITRELREGIRDAIRANWLHATDVTSSSARLTWPRLLDQDSGYYSLEYGPRAEPGRRRTQHVSGAHTSLVLSGLAPETTYEVALIPESNVLYLPPQSTSLTTLAEEISPVQVLISECGPHSFQVSWAPVLDSVARYQLLYGPLPGNSAQVLEVDGRHNSTVVEHLAPSTTYLVTVTAIYRSGSEKSLSVKACTQEATEAQEYRDRERA